MAVQFRSLFPLALPGMLALLGWWWFFSRKKQQVSSNKEQAESGAVALSAGPTTKEPLPTEEACSTVVSVPLSVTQLPRNKESAPSKPSTEPPAPLWMHLPHHRSESSGSLQNTTDVRSQPGTRKDNTTKVELAVMGDKAKPVPLGCPLTFPKDLLFSQEAAEVCKQEPTLSGMPTTEKRGAGEKAREREMGGTEGNGDAVLGETVLAKGLLPQERALDPENGKAFGLAPSGGKIAKGSGSLPLVVGPVRALPKEEYPLGKLPGVLVQSAKEEATQTPWVTSGNARDKDPVGELGKEEALDENEKLEQAAFQIISQVILEATEEVLATTDQAAANQPQGRKEEENCAPVSQETLMGRDIIEPTLATAGAAASSQDTALPSPGPLAADLPPPKTYVSCLSSPLSSPTKDRKPKNSAHPISLAPCPAPDTPLRESLDQASSLAGDATCVTCMLDKSQSVSPVTTSGQCSDSVSMSGLGDSCTETNSSPKDNNRTPPLPASTQPFSNGVLKGELSDVGTEDGWSVDAEADHSGGSDANSMDSENCWERRKTDDLQNAQAGSNPKKVDLIIWEIEVPKHLVGRLIGKQGRYVSFLKQTSGAKIYISTLPYTQNIQICHIEGSQHHVDKALNLIGKKFKELNLTNIYAPPLPSLALPSLPMTSWLMLPDGITVEVIVVNQVNAGHLFVQQHTHPTFHALRSLDQQMYLCYSQPGIPTLPTPVKIMVICAAPGVDGAWWRAQVVASYEETNEVEIRYVDYGGYKRVKVDVLRQIRSDFVTLPFQGAEVLLDSVMPLSDDDHFSPEADAAMSEMTGNTALLAQVTSYSPTGLPLIQLWSVVGDEVVLINRSLVERGLAQWVDSYYLSL
ncbi:A-kinase anchor protein 1, mitochondrial [Cavia porcellus]|uniref:A-kinase anchoring protein 1 n=1 Tax=Cavia porcellus TaxID=10141 RepID=H0VNG9_CAVPO|nr:A-kinase anchor protein 1, mitochondrial isoform X2 [Cavia porcellus]